MSRNTFTEHLLSRDTLARGIVAHLQPGDLFLWDSRATHGATPGDLVAAAAATEDDGKQLFRAAAYVCMAPTNHASVRVLQQREEMLLAHRGTGAFCAAYDRNGSRTKGSQSGSSFEPVLQNMKQLSDAQWQLVIGKARAAGRASKRKHAAA